ncbi:uncharacterized protein LOC114559275 [Perca flavescens]|uniref:uncharacterized protein LOC114559275 n=1 Tax=Perca flavescens TaxID=8167 RepID=UPI00106DE07F|nr:uncharacterized protein LOC114559275 [Perca flavescens]
MNVCPTLICFFFLSLQDGNSGLAKAKIFVHTGTEGEDIRVNCSFSQSGNTRFFCKNECKQGDLLIETTDVTAQSGRYGMKYETSKLKADVRFVNVSISQLTRSDSGLYRCGLRNSSSAASYVDFRIRVVDALQDGNSGLAKAQISVYPGTEGEDIRVTCPFPSSGSTKVFCKNDCKEKDLLVATTNVSAQSGRFGIEYEELIPGANVSVSISQLTKSDSGWYSCGLNGSTMSYVDFRIIVVDALLTGNPPEVKTFNKTSGDNVVVACNLSDYGEKRLYFCKERCENKDKDILVETSDLSAQRDRYSIEYVGGSPSGVFVYVSISQLTRSDSGLYRCGLEIPFSPDHYREFRINVTDASNTTEPNTTLPMFPSSVSSTSTSPHTETPSPRAQGVLLYVGLPLVVLVLVLVLVSLSLLILCRRRRSKARGRPVETEYAVTETSRVYEDIREDGLSPPVEISSVYSSAKYSKPSAAETNDDYSVITAANLQNTAEEDSGRLTYSEVHFTNRATGSLNSSLRGDADHVVYSVPRVRDDSDAAPPEDDPPVYSTVH